MQTGHAKLAAAVFSHEFSGQQAKSTGTKKSGGVEGLEPTNQERV
jgi:hypothetical protein